MGLHVLHVVYPMILQVVYSNINSMNNYNKLLITGLLYNAIPGI